MRTADSFLPLTSADAEESYRPPSPVIEILGGAGLEYKPLPKPKAEDTNGDDSPSKPSLRTQDSESSINVRVTELQDCMDLDYLLRRLNRLLSSLSCRGGGQRKDCGLELPIESNVWIACRRFIENCVNEPSKNENPSRGTLCEVARISTGGGCRRKH